MSESIGGIHYDLDLNDQDFKGKVKKADLSMEGLKKRFKDAEGASSALLGSIVALGAGVVAFGVSSVNAYNDANRAEAKLIQLHHENTGATMKQTKELLDQADALQRIGVVEGDAIKNGQAQLATFKLSTGAIKALTPAMTDMVAHIKGANATGEDFVNIGNLIGKVMEGNIGALGRYGVSFDKNQEKVLKNGNQSERAAMLAKILAQNYGGVNKALAETPEGKLASIKNKFGDIQESLGKTILEGINPFLDAIGNQMDILLEDGEVIDHINNMLSENKELLYGIAGAIIIGVLPALGALVASMAPILPFIAVGALLGVVVHRLVEAFGGWGNLINYVKDQVNKLWNVIGPILMPTLQQLYGAFVNDLIPALQRMWSVVGPVLIPVLQFLAKLIGVVLFVALMVIINAFTVGIKIISGFINIWVNLIKNIKEKGIDGIKEWFRKLPEEIGKMLSGIAKAILAPFDGAFDRLKDKLKEIKNKISDALNPFVKHSPSLVEWVIRGANKIEDTYSGMMSRIGDISSVNRKEIVGGVKDSMVNESSGNEGGLIRRGGVNNIVVPLSGVITSSPGELRQVALRIKESLDQVMRSEGPKLNISRS